MPKQEKSVILTNFENDVSNTLGTRINGLLNIHIPTIICNSCMLQGEDAEDRVKDACADELEKISMELAKYICESIHKFYTNLYIHGVLQINTVGTASSQTSIPTIIDAKYPNIKNNVLRGTPASLNQFALEPLDK